MHAKENNLFSLACKKLDHTCSKTYLHFCHNQNADWLNGVFWFCSPELEKGLKKRVKLHTHENGENGKSRENGQNGQNEDIDSDENYTEVTNMMRVKGLKRQQNTAKSDGTVHLCV